jgi:hypothetical protein
MKMTRLWWLVVILAVVSVFPVAAQDTGRILVDSGLFDVGSVDIYVDDELILAEQSQMGGAARLDLAAGSHTMTVTLPGEALESPLLGPTDFTVEAGRLYLVAPFCSVEDECARILTLDLGDISQDEASTPPHFIIFNLIDGAPAIDFITADETKLASGIAAGDSATVDAPDLFADSFVIRETDSGEELTGLDRPEELPDILTGPNILYLYAAFGDYSDKEGIAWFAIPLYYKDLTETDGGAISVGDSQTVDLAAGQRAGYTLTLDAPATVDVMLENSLPENDAYLRIYDSDGELIEENDEIDFEDDDFSAGIEGLALEAGTYTIEAASYLDTSPGSYTLSVAESAATPEATGEAS